MGHGPVGVQMFGADPSTIIVEDLQTGLKHPFEPSMIPILYYGARQPEAPRSPPMAASCEAYSPTSTESTAVTHVSSSISPLQVSRLTFPSKCGDALKEKLIHFHALELTSFFNLIIVSGLHQLS